MIKMTNRVASVIAYVAALGLATGVSAQDAHWELDVDNAVTYAQEIFGGEDAADMDLTLGAGGADVVLNLVLASGTTAEALSEIEVTFMVEGAVFGQAVNWTDITTDGNLDKVSGSQSGGRAGQTSITVRVEVDVDIVQGTDAASITLNLPSLEDATALLEGGSVTASASVMVTGGPDANLPWEVMTRATVPAGPGPDGIPDNSDDIAEVPGTSNIVASTAVGVTFAAADGDTGYINLDDRTMLVQMDGSAAMTQTIALAIFSSTARTAVEEDGVTAFATGAGAEADVAVTASALGNDGTAYIDLNANNAMDDGEALPIVEGVASESVRLSAAGAATVYYTPDGETPMRSSTFTTSFAVDYDAESAVDPADAVSGSASLEYQGVELQARAYAIPNAGMNDIGNVRIRCGAGGDTTCAVFLDCDGQDGTGYFGELSSTVAAGATMVLQAEGIGEALGVDAWNGRLSCDVMSNRNVSVQVLVRSDGSLINNTYVDGD